MFDVLGSHRCGGALEYDTGQGQGQGWTKQDNITEK